MKYSTTQVKCISDVNNVWFRKRMTCVAAGNKVNLQWCQQRLPEESIRSPQFAGLLYPPMVFTVLFFLLVPLLSLFLAWIYPCLIFVSLTFSWVIQFVRTHQSGKHFTPSFPPSYAHVRLLRSPPHCVRTPTHLTPIISNGNVFTYRINNSLEKDTVDHLRDRKIIIGNVL